MPSDVPGCTTEPAAATSPPAAIRRRREGCRDISSYRTEGKVGEGTFGCVLFVQGTWAVSLGRALAPLTLSAGS